MQARGRVLVRSCSRPVSALTSPCPVRPRRRPWQRWRPGHPSSNGGWAVRESVDVRAGTGSWRAKCWEPHRTGTCARADDPNGPRAPAHLEVGIKLVHKGHAGRNVELEDGLFGHVVQVFDERAKRVSVRGDDDTLAALDGRRDCVVPDRQEARDGVLQRLTLGDIRRVHTCVPAVLARKALVRLLEWRRRRVVAAAPDEHLLIAELLGGLGLVESLRCEIEERNARARPSRVARGAQLMSANCQARAQCDRDAHTRGRAGGRAGGRTWRSP